MNLWLIKAAPNLVVSQGTDINPYRWVHRVYLIKWTVSKYSTPLYKTDKVQLGQIIQFAQIGFGFRLLIVTE